MVIYFSIFIGTLIVDQLTKMLVQVNMYNTEISIIKNIFSFTYVENYGAAWGILSEYNSLLKILPIVFIIIILFYLIKYKPRKLEMISGILVMSGAMGNFIDRIRLGYVIDFIDFKVWPVFNFADIWIVLGCMLMIISLYRKDEDYGN